MKKVKLIPILIIVCLLVAGAAVYSIVASVTGGYNPDRYITLGDYKNISIENPYTDPTEKELEQALQDLLAKFGTTSQVTDAIREGDTVNINYVGRINGKQSNAFTDQDLDIVVGKDSFLVTGLDAYITGAKKGDTVTAPLTVQKDYYLEQYAGKTITFTVTINSVTRTTVPALDDDFAKKLGDYKTADEFLAAFQKQYTEEKRDQNAASLRNDLWSAVVDTVTVRAYPQKELKALLDEFNATVQAGADEYEMSFYDYASFAYGTEDKETFETYATEYCQNLLKQKMVLKALCKHEKISLSEDEYQAYIDQYLALYKDQNYTMEDLLNIFGGEEGLREQFLMEKATDVIQSTATIKNPA